MSKEKKYQVREEDCEELFESIGQVLHKGSKIVCDFVMEKLEEEAQKEKPKTKPEKKS